jgi:H+-transporting ATPase
MLEASIALELILGKTTDAIITIILLFLNAELSFTQENRAHNALALLRQHLTIQARVLRDERWQLVPAKDLVPDDVVRLRVGDIVPADVRLIEGRVSADQSTLTGESTPADVEVGGTAYAGSLIKSGEATCQVTATGARTYYGRTAELVHTARTASHLESIIVNIVKYLVTMDVTLVVAIVLYALVHNFSLGEVLPFALILLVASVPVALPATFTLAGALGSLELSGHNVLVTRLSAIEEAAAMNVLCSDKTGTITKNQLTLAATCIYSPFSEADLLRFAALASDEATQDPIDLAILNGARDRGIPIDLSHRSQFIPFDPMTKRTEATINQDHQTWRVVKGIPYIIASIAADGHHLDHDVDQLAAQGYRVLAVAAGPAHATVNVIGLVALQDPPREDSKTVIQQLRELGVRVLMITGDGLATARAIASQVGITGEACSGETLRQDQTAATAKCEVFAGVFPEDKFRLVQTLQQAGHVVGMTGDGVNDAPALKQAEVGVAVANATDVAKAAASMILNNAGLSDMLMAIKIGRQIYQRMLTYTLNKIIKTFQIALLLSLGLLALGIFVTRPRLVLLLLFANDFVTMALATDNVSYSRKPDRWAVRPLAASAMILACAWLIFSFGVLLIGRDALHLDLDRLQTLIFLTLVFTGQANVYLIRERHHFWHSIPSRWLMLSTVFDFGIIGLLATQGVLMAPIAPELLWGLLAAVALYLFALDWIKIRVFEYFNLH